jgi:SAM-dependent methyltransferase
MSPRLCGDLATWWPLFSEPGHYAPEAEWVLDALRAELGRLPPAMLELGSGGGNLASHLQGSMQLTLVDPSSGMLAHSRSLVPQAEHIEGDMRTVRLGRTFGAVLIHDAIMYMTTEDDLVAALTSARVHLAPEGVLVVLPDYVAETFEPGIETGGNDAPDGRRGIRYICWNQAAPAHGATLHHSDYAIMLRETDGSVEVVHDRHAIGIFPRDTWRRAFARAGLAAPRICSDPWRQDVFIARPAGAPHRPV